MPLPSPLPDASYAGIWRTAWPIMLANVAVPLLGLADTAVIGQLGALQELGALALGSMIFNFVYWTFGFLRMGTTGFVAQARGAGDTAEVHLATGRAVLLGAGLGGLLIIGAEPIAELALSLIGGSDSVQAFTREYVAARIWGAPGALCSFALMGALIGLGQSRALLLVQLFANALNLVLDVLFAGVLGWGVRGIGLGTAVSEWAAALLGGLLLAGSLGLHRPAPGELSRLLRLNAVLGTLRAHANIMLRTLLLLLGFAWFTRESARFGDATLAANHVLLQFVSFAAFFLDGYAFATESMVGAAHGARRRDLFDQVVWRSFRLALLTALALCAGIALSGRIAIGQLTDLDSVRALAGEYLVYPVVYVAVAVWAFQLDGIFIGMTRTAEMRNCSLISVLALLAAGVPLSSHLQNHGLWLAFILYAAARGASLGLLYPRLRRSVAVSHAPG